MQLNRKNSKGWSQLWASWQVGMAQAKADLDQYFSSPPPDTLQSFPLWESVRGALSINILAVWLFLGRYKQTFTCPQTGGTKTDTGNSSIQVYLDELISWLEPLTGACMTQRPLHDSKASYPHPHMHTFQGNLFLIGTSSSLSLMGLKGPSLSRTIIMLFMMTLFPNQAFLQNWMIALLPFRDGLHPALTLQMKSFKGTSHLFSSLPNLSHLCKL